MKCLKLPHPLHNKGLPSSPKGFSGRSPALLTLVLLMFPGLAPRQPHLVLLQSVPAGPGPRLEGGAPRAHPHVRHCGVRRGAALRAG